MGDLIDRDAAIEMYGDWYTKEMTEGGFVGCLYSLLETLPAVDAAPVVYSEWSLADGGKCKNCGFHNSNFDYNYCPMCGAKMWR